ncbi:hypothetical protein BH11CYA1_BH11CYA1_01920 [soil metagenome]
MSRPRSIASKGLIIVILLLAVQSAFVGVIAYSIFKTRAQLIDQQHTLAVIESSSRIAKNLQVISTLLTMKASTMISSAEFTGAMVKARQELDGDFKQLRLLAANDSAAQAILYEQSRYVKQAQALYEEDMRQEFFKKRHREQEYKGSSAAVYEDVVGRYNHLLMRYRRDSELRNTEAKVFVGQLKQLVIIGALLNLFGGLALAYFFSTSVSRRIEALSRTIAKLEESDDLDLESAAISLTSEENRGRDELGDIARSFAHMLQDLGQAARSEAMLIDGAYDVICALDQENHFVNVNAAAQTQWGRAALDLIGRHISDIAAPSDLARFVASLATFRASGAGAVDLKVLSGSAAIIETRWSCHWSSAEKLMVCFVRDTSELNRQARLAKQAEEQVTALVSNLPVGVLVVAKDGVVTIANQKMSDLVGAAMVRPGNLVAVERVFNTESAEVNKSVLGNDGELLFVVKDVRERLRLESIKRDFVAILQTSLREPLKNVRDRVAAVAQGGASEQEGKAQRIVRNSDRLLHLIDELVKVETLKPGNIIGDLDSIDLKAVLADAASALSGYAAIQGVNIALSGQRLVIFADQERLLQVVINLLSNAIKFSVSGSTVEVHHHALSSPSNWVEVSIIDSGRGIPAEMHGTIFDSYVQANAADKQKGTGLGLAICKTIIEAHGGFIGVESLPQGSRFWFCLPLTRPDNSGGRS